MSTTTGQKRAKGGQAVCGLRELTLGRKYAKKQAREAERETGEGESHPNSPDGPPHMQLNANTSSEKENDKG